MFIIIMSRYAKSDHNTKSTNGHHFLKNGNFFAHSKRLNVWRQDSRHWIQ